MVRLLCAHGAKLNPKCSETTPLYEAVDAGNLETAEELCKQGADPNKLGTDVETAPQTPLDLAALRGDLAMIRTLIKRGALLTKSAKKSGATSLHRAAMGGNPTVVREVLKLGGNPKTEDQWGLTPSKLINQDGTQYEDGWGLFDYAFFPVRMAYDALCDDDKYTRVKRLRCKEILEEAEAA